MELLDRYNDLYETMANSQNPDKMRVFGEAEKWAFAQIAASHPQVARQWLERLEPVGWNNFLARAEADEIAASLVDQDGKAGPVWTYAQVEDAVRSLGGKMECAPYYNGAALYVTMNMLVSDHYNSLKEFVPEESIPEIIYNMAVEKLKDMDRREFIRPYFGL